MKVVLQMVLMLAVKKPAKNPKPVGGVRLRGAKCPQALDSILRQAAAIGLEDEDWRIEGGVGREEKDWQGVRSKRGRRTLDGIVEGVHACWLEGAFRLRIHFQQPWHVV